MPMTDGAVEPLLFGERVVTLTEASALRLRSAGVSGVEVIRPCVPMPETPLSLEAARRRLRLSLPEL